MKWKTPTITDKFGGGGGGIRRQAGESLVEKLNDDIANKYGFCSDIGDHGNRNGQLGPRSNLSDRLRNGELEKNTVTNPQ
ncbi:hypothetical protein D5086_032142 [Populus alba]|uniref:Uncharacterized protein n=1 Tax=Populus alba TaxID=43335 RepID=A0ACC4AKK3_POPAL